ncbi:DUF6236 family protein [Nonomuraea sp. WAC 01424]|uniref:DUF6236 family protein n=1 Tax=Nonomuraea sp. WAC 01424 TaxID=2203200 RepID=UPI0021AD7D97|nr:DUF6236 family protein [Nonomuraea sp. WAC 01424]
MRRIGLYYPYIHFRDDKWLKAAALYWPAMARVVPAGYQPKDSAVARALADELAFITDVNPGTAASTVSPTFASVVAQHASQLQHLHPLSARHLSALGLGTHDLVTWHRTGPLDAVEVDTEGSLLPTGIITGEMDHTLQESLFEAGLAYSGTRIQGGSERWVVVHPQLAWVYKCALTKEVARQSLLQPTTDQVATQSADQEWTAEQILEALLPPVRKQGASQHAPELSHKVASLALHVALPSNLDDIPAKKIIRLRKKYGADFDAFGAQVTATVTDLADTLADVENLKVLDTYIQQEVERRFKRPLDDLRKAMRSERIDSVFGVLNVKFEAPSLIALAATSGGIAAENFALTGVGMAFGLLGAARASRKARAEKQVPLSASYLLHIGKLKPRSLLRKVAQESTNPARRQ